MLTQAERDELVDAIEGEISAKIALKRADGAVAVATADAAESAELARREARRKTIAATQRRDDLIAAAVQRGLS